MAARSIKPTEPLAPRDSSTMTGLVSVLAMTDRLIVSSATGPASSLLSSNVVQRPRANAVPSPSGVLSLVLVRDSTAVVAPSGSAFLEDHGVLLKGVHCDCRPKSEILTPTLIGQASKRSALWQRIHTGNMMKLDVRQVQILLLTMGSTVSRNFMFSERLHLF